MTDLFQARHDLGTRQLDDVQSIVREARAVLRERFLAADAGIIGANALVAETGSFSLAAEKLHLTQPAVSKRVALLEEQLGTGLFDRIGRNISLTEAGQALLPHALAVQRELDAAQQSVRDLSGAVAGELRLATSHHIGLHRNRHTNCSATDGDGQPTER